MQVQHDLQVFGCHLFDLSQRNFLLLLELPLHLVVDFEHQKQQGLEVLQRQLVFFLVEIRDERQVHRDEGLGVGVYFTQVILEGLQILVQ